MILIAYRSRGAAIYTHHFRVEARSWRAFYRHARICRRHSEYARISGSDYVPVLA